MINIHDSLNGNKKHPANYVNATFACKAEVLDADGKPAKQVSANIESKYKQKIKIKKPDITDVPRKAESDETASPKSKSAGNSPPPKNNRA